MPDADGRIRVAIPFAYPEVTASVVYAMHDLLAAAGRDWAFITTGVPGSQRVLPYVVSTSSTDIQTANGVWIKADHTIHDCPPRGYRLRAGLPPADRRPLHRALRYGDSVATLVPRRGSNACPAQALEPDEAISSAAAAGQHTLDTAQIMATANQMMPATILTVPSAGCISMNDKPMLRRRPKTSESREVTRPGISAMEIPAWSDAG